MKINEILENRINTLISERNMGQLEKNLLDAGFVKEVTDNASCMDEEDDEDEFSVAAHASKSAIQTTTTKDGFSYVCVQPPNVPGHETQGNPKFAWCIKHGDRYPSATAFHEFVNTKYSKERNFMVRKKSSNRKAPKEIPDGCHPPDGIYAQMVVCTLAGAPARKKEGIAEEKRRDRKSLKCGCGWGVRGKWDWKSKEYVIQVEPEKNLLHTNGCNPTPAQKLISITHRGGAPQKLRLKRNHEAAPLTAAFAQQKFAVGVSVSASQVTEIAHSRSRHSSQRDTLCRFCGAAGCSHKRCPKVARFGSRFVLAQTFFTTVQQLLSTPVLFHTLPILEEVQHGQLLDVDDNWKTGKDFRHIVLKSWLRSSAPQQSGKVFISIRRIKKNLVWLDHEELGVVVDGEQLYEKFVKYKLAKKSVSKIIIVQGLYINAN